MTSPITIRPATIESNEKIDLYERDARERKFIARWLIGSATALLVGLAGFEMVARYLVFSSKPASSPNPQYDMKYRVASSLSPLNDNVILCGDSLMKEGLYPELITAKLKKNNEHIRVTNLAVTGGTQKDAVQYLEFLRTRGVRPKLVAFDFEVSNTCLPTEANNIEWGQSHSYLFRGLLTRPKNFKEASQLAPSDFSYLMRQRANLKRSFTDFFATLSSPRKFEEVSFYKPADFPEHEISTAGMAPNNRVSDKIDWTDEQRKIGFFTPFCPQSPAYKYNADAYSIIIGYCQKNQIPLLMVWLPHQTRVYRAYYYKAPYDEAWHRQQFESYSKLPLVSTEYLNVLPDDSSYFHDYRHLDTYGCVKSSELFAQALSNRKYRPLLEGARK